MSRARRVALLCAGVLACTVPAARALPPDQIFDRVAPGVWSVKAYGAEERLLASASGVVVAPGKVVTSCQVLARARQVQLRRGNTIYDAKLEFPDLERDLCQLDVPGLSAPAPALGSARGLRTGQRLYVVGFGQGNVPTLGEGLVSVVGQAGGRELIQTSVPVAASLRGAGVFDEEARLVGIVTFSPADAPATAFAVPADLLAEVAARGSAAIAALAARAKPPVSAASTGAPGLPAAGTVWTYEFSDRVFRRRQGGYSVRVVRVDGSTVEESVTSGSSADARRAISATGARFVEHAFTATSSVMELSPYLLAASADKPPAEVSDPEGYPIGSRGLPSWIVKATVQGWDQVAVPAGTFKALRVDVKGRRSAPIGGRTSFAGRFEMSVWYAPDVDRIVRQEHRVWTADAISPALIADEVVELAAFRPPS